MRHSRADRADRGLSLVEVLVTLVILSVSLVPIITLFTSSQRMGTSARKLVDVTLHAQTIVEALAQLDPADFPVVAAGQESTLLADGGPPLPGGSARFDEVAAFFAKPPPIAMERRVTARRLASGEMLVRIDVAWQAVVGERATRHTISIPMLAAPRNWQ